MAGAGRLYSYVPAPFVDVDADISNALASSLVRARERQSAEFDDLHEAVSTLEETGRLWTRVFGEAHPETLMVQGALAFARKKLAAAEPAASESKPPP